MISMLNSSPAGPSSGPSVVQKPGDTYEVARPFFLEFIEDVTEILLDAGFYAQRLLGPEIRAILDAAEDGA